MQKIWSRSDVKETLGATLFKAQTQVLKTQVELMLNEGVKFEDIMNTLDALNENFRAK